MDPAEQGSALMALFDANLKRNEDACSTQQTESTATCRTLRRVTRHFDRALMNISALLKLKYLTLPALP